MHVAPKGMKSEASDDCNIRAAIRLTRQTSTIQPLNGFKETYIDAIGRK
jgi:hypothetical protein